MMNLLIHRVILMRNLSEKAKKKERYILSSLTVDVIKRKIYLPYLARSVNIINGFNRFDLVKCYTFCKRCVAHIGRYSRAILKS